MSAELVAVAVASTLGSLHCAGMCGGFVAFYSGGSSDEAAGKLPLAPHLAYNGGRLVTYVALGVLAGVIGNVADIAGRAAGLGRIAAVVAGSVMLIWGLVLLVGASRPGSKLTGRLSKWVAPRLARLRGRPPTTRALLLGLASTLLPCGWLYAFAVTAAGTGSPLWGGLVMAAFWLGTVPVMLGLGLGAQRLAGRLRKHVPLIGALGLIAIGVFTLVDRADISGRLVKIEARARSTMTGAAAPPHATAEDQPCCDPGAH